MIHSHETKNKMNNKNKPAFGFVDTRSSSYEDNEIHYGLTKREYFAAMAMQGLLANPNLGQTYDMSEVASMAYNRADELLIELG